ncbi:hypothetical protein SPI_06033 [Niveomyces insectorum RCEF 264]|uniref:Uncharacterized protein n=1 Tax=Niveomyces insectorum RCEF 264 TaxID=1081102 RepID=A0A167SQJ1_9HYPO|nr:hypothetical protein SPI_06033 [Niveomyces insectorum RCEF 264]
MASKRLGKAAASRGGAASSSSTPSNRDPPAPFKPAPRGLAVFYDKLSPRHAYVAHVDTAPRSFKRKIFSVPVLMNLAVVLLFAWRVWYVGPYYFLLFQTALGRPNETTLVSRDLSWLQLATVVLRRGATFGLDLVLAIFVWPWPVEFCMGSRHSNPVAWRWAVGFRDREIYVRRSRSWYTVPKGGASATATTASSAGGAPQIDLVNDDEARRLLVAHLRQATSPLLTQQKTGYLTMDGNWDLDWALMVWATHLVDTKELALEAFTTLVLLHHDAYGWLTVDTRALSGASGPSAGGGADDERRRQVFAFRDALAALDKEDLFFRWIEIIQFETSRPGGLGDAERQAAVAKQVRDVFEEQGVDFDALWKETVGTDGLAGM